MQFVHVLFLAISAMPAIYSLKCYVNEKGQPMGEPETIPVMASWYKMPGMHRTFGVCSIDEDGTRSYWISAFGGDNAPVCIRLPHTSTIRCFCSRNACNTHMPDIYRHIALKVNCVSPGGRPYTCGGTEKTWGNVCATRVETIQKIRKKTLKFEVKVFGFCAISLGGIGCATSQSDRYMDSHMTWCVGKGRVTLA